MLTTLWDEIGNFFDPIIDFFRDLWTSIQDFLLQYMSQEVLNIFILLILVGIVMFVVLAIINKN